MTSITFSDSYLGMLPQAKYAATSTLEPMESCWEWLSLRTTDLLLPSPGNQNDSILSKLWRISGPRLAIQKIFDLGRIVGRLVAQYLTWGRVDYLYLRQILQIVVQSSLIGLRYSCFQPFMGHSQINI